MRKYEVYIWTCINSVDTKSLTFYAATQAAACTACGVI
jgi:hypothetical protein